MVPFLERPTTTPWLVPALLTRKKVSVTYHGMCYQSDLRKSHYTQALEGRPP